MRLQTLFANRLHRQIVRFLIVGAIVSAIDLGLFLLMLRLNLPRSVANIVGMTGGFLAGLIGHHHFTFSMATPLERRVVLRYATSFAFNLLLGSISLEGMVRIGAGPLLAKLIAMAVVVVSNFIISRQFVFRQR